MLTKDIVLQEKVFVTPVGSAAPPAVFKDVSRYGNDGTYSNVTPLQLPSGLWVRNHTAVTANMYLPSGGGSPYISIKSIGLYLSLSVWFYVVAANASIVFFDTSGPVGAVGHECYVRTTGDMVFKTCQAGPTQQATTSNTGKVLVGRWYHGAATCSGISAKVYLNGYDITTTSGVHLLPAIQTNQTFAFANTGYQTLLKVFKYALSAGQIANIFQKERYLFGV